MAEYFAFQAALCFSVANILVRRGLVHSNALTGSFISLATSAAAFWMLLPWFVPLSALWRRPSSTSSSLVSLRQPSDRLWVTLGLSGLGSRVRRPSLIQHRSFLLCLQFFSWEKCGCSGILSERVSSSSESSYFLQSGRLEARGASAMLFIQFWGHWPSAYRPPFAKPA